MKKRIIAIAIIAVMALGIFALTGCETFSLAEYKVSAKAEIENYAISDDYSTDNWVVILGYIADGKTAIEEAETKPQVDAAVVTAKNAINTVLTKEQEMADFILTIKVEKAVLSKGDDIQVEIVFKNNTGEVLEISHTSSWIMPFIAEWYESGVIDINLSTIQKDETIVRTPKIGSNLPKGKYELVAKATFTVLQFEGDKIVASQDYLIESKAIQIIVK